MAEPGYDNDGNPLVQGVVTAIGVAVHTGDDTAARIEAAIVAAILQANAEGISSEEKNTPILKERMRIAREDEMAKITAERSGQ